LSGLRFMRRMNTPELDIISKVLPLAMLAFALGGIIDPGIADSTDVEIDYSHNVVGTGTVMTDFKMGSEDSTEASGMVRGSGEVLNKYVFSSNNSDNITIEDSFLFTKAQETDEVTLADFPEMKEIAGDYRLRGTAWAESINLSYLNQGGNLS